eukprot:TRINITY_DN15970_c0_g1_i2.p3 TRINITY_DN15970_c0_g1~~TRINITY_DN15970_c0_g1_i2.p3  ORF type:complete len:102 (+),score=14.22 TRINITY_DN15970_c0_g1_i2:215-520(+)
MTLPPFGSVSEIAFSIPQKYSASLPPKTQRCTLQSRRPPGGELKSQYRVRSADGLSPLLVGRCIGREISASGPVCVLVHGDGLTRRVPVEDLLQVSLAVEA